MQNKIITFYSYKGGVGRTMALANAACQLANKHGLDVIAVDWDLEAPGLHYYFDFTDQELEQKPGLIDYLYDFVEEIKKGQSGKVPSFENYLTVPKQHISKKIKNGSVTLLTCGMTNQLYMSRVQKFNWAEFYEEYEGYQIIETLKKQLLGQSNVVLIDSRAGQADISSTSTIQIPDALLFFFTSNKQSLEGTANLARKLKQHPFRVNQGFDDIRMLMIPSRVFSEDDRFDYWLKSVANPVFDKLVKDGVIEKEDQPKGLQQCVLGIEPRFTFKEELPVLDETYFQSSLKASYEQLAFAITDLLEGRRLWSSLRTYPFMVSLNERNTPVIAYSRNIELSCDAKVEAESLKAELSSAADRGDDHRSAYLQFKLGQVLAVLDKVEEAETLLEASLTYNKSRGFLDAVSAIEYSLGNLKLQATEYKDAIRHFDESIKIDRFLKNLAGESSAHYQIGIAQHWLELYEDAIRSFKNALKLAIKLDNKSLEGKLYNSIALSYYAIQKSAQALKYLEKYLKFGELIGDKGHMLTAYFALGIVYQAQKKYALALENFRKSEAICLTLNNKLMLINCYDSIAEVYNSTSDSEKAISFYIKAAEVSKEDSNLSYLVKSLVGLAQVYLSNRDLLSAKKTLAEALDAAKRLKDKSILKKIRALKTKMEKFT